MRLGIDAREIQGGIHTGIGRPLANFLKYFATLGQDDQCVLFSSRPVPIKFGDNIRNIVLPECWTQYWDQITLAAALKRERIEIFYSPYYKLPLLASCKCVCAVLDLMYLVVPEYHRELSLAAKLYYAVLGKKYLQKADKILTCSEYSRNDIIRIYGVEASKIEIIPLSVSRMYYPETDEVKIDLMKMKYGISGRYLLYLGNLKPHKNVKNIINAFSRIAVEFNDLSLVIAGPKEHLYHELAKQAGKLGLSPRIIFTGTISESDHPHIMYSGAEVFVMPSLYEGFGLPPAEAMACGVPVVASNTTSIPEVVKDAGILVNPENADDIARAIKNILQNPDLRRELVSKGLDYVKEYEEVKIARQNYEFFKRVLYRL